MDASIAIGAGSRAVTNYCACVGNKSALPRVSSSARQLRRPEEKNMKRFRLTIVAVLAFHSTANAQIEPRPWSGQTRHSVIWQIGSGTSVRILPQCKQMCS